MSGPAIDRIIEITGVGRDTADRAARAAAVSKQRQRRRGNSGVYIDGSGRVGVPGRRLI
jgi:hypothetical protein